MKCLSIAKLERAMAAWNKLVELEARDVTAVPLEAGLIVLARWNTPQLDTNSVLDRIQVATLT